MNLSVMFLLMLLLPALSSPGADAPSLYHLDSPILPVETGSVILHDAARSKDLSVAATFPREGGPFPLIIFSHGAGGSGEGAEPLSSFWASHGCVCLAPTHADSVLARRRAGETFTLRDAVDVALNDETAWTNRPRDISFLLDSLDDLPKSLPKLAGKIDRTRIAVAGHSFGAYTSQVIAGATVRLTGKAEPASFADSRVRAALLFSPQGIGQMGLTRESWKDIRIPLMSITGSRDYGARGQSPEWRKTPFYESPPGDKYLLFIEGASHMTFTGRLASEDSSSLPALLRPARVDTAAEAVFLDRVKSASLVFFDAYLKDSPAARRYLLSTALNAPPASFFRR
ncbi:MAG: hypothetical protein V2A58_16875 [Planctomycetota bacterium]